LAAGRDPITDIDLLIGMLESKKSFRRICWNRSFEGMSCSKEKGSARGNKELLGLEGSVNDELVNF